MNRRALVTGAAASLALAACGSAGPRARRGAQQRVVVVGAGLAGLVSALELQRAGWDVTIVEARARPGGRVETLREPFADGLYAEAGATFISDAHTLVQRYCRQLELPLRRVTTRGAGEVYHVGGRRVLPGDPNAVWPMPLVPEERALGLRGMWKKYLEDALGSLRDDYDTMTGAQFLQSRGASPGAVTLLGLGYLELAGDGVGSYSALAMLRDLAHRRAEKESFAIAGGNDRLPRALAAHLGERLRYRTPVVRIEPGARSVTLVVRDGGAPGRIEADRVVCTVPGSVLKSIEVVPVWSAAKRRALDALSYTSVTRVFVQTGRRPGESAPLSLTTDRPIQWVWESSAGQRGRRGILESYIAGAAARRVALMSADERIAFVREELARVLPTVGGTIERGVSKAWDDDPYARGAYAWFKPGEATTLPKELARPEGRVHFAGEHVSSKPGWMEGAIESALRVVDEIVAAV